MKLHELQSTIGSRKEKHRKGRGHAAGKGKQAGKGQSGQRKRSSVRPGFEGGQNPLFRRIPKIGFNNINSVKYQTVSLAKLEEKFENNSSITIRDLFDKKLVRRKTMPVKILALGKLTKTLHIETDACSTKAKEIIENLKGTVKLI
ncbi:50S ribosomal protein L15 [Mesomycoplasma neurolyticum]|uniref:Large ribosomal subunit protein uL15 n=1 Tax=Mesomycoplasma neurolyticum TaxID=2120 RepID=A0A449A681_9BACT|nr:50S ribosomal protein L15 [Mesomycoplasma neurolyticum]VEU59744.1 50S ribosomal protein L15 [Mesomycoplasma neurolyticum]